MILLKNKIYCFWTGDNQMSPSRRKCFDTMLNSQCEVVLVTPDNLNNYLKPTRPLHPAYPYLSLTHKSDYLRCYFMHHFGGGYSDIKTITSSWDQAFEDLEKSNCYINGYQEIGPHGVAIVPEPLYTELKNNYQKIIGCGSFICKPYSNFTTEWYNQLHKKLDYYLPFVKQNPAVHPQEKPGMIINGSPSKYPIQWSDLLGSIFHPLCLKYHNYIRQTVPMFKITSYR